MLLRLNNTTSVLDVFTFLAISNTADYYYLLLFIKLHKLYTVEQIYIMYVNEKVLI